jgi:hypothetical protein
MIFEPHGRAEQDDQARQRVGPNERRDPEKGRRRENCRRRIPREAREHRPAQPLGQRPAAAEDHCKGDPVVAAEAPREACRDRRIDGEIERQEHDRDPAEPGRHLRLEGERRGDPVEPDHELAKAERPADEQAVRELLRPTDQLAQDAESHWKQRPPTHRLERERGYCARYKGVKHVDHSWGWLAVTTL